MATKRVEITPTAIILTDARPATEETPLPPPILKQSSQPSIVGEEQVVEESEKAESVAYRLLPTDRKAVTEQEYYEFENRLRTVVWDILKPLDLKANDIREHQR